MQHIATGILQTLGFCGIRNQVVNVIAFRPPTASTYELRLRKKKQLLSATKSQDDSILNLDSSQNRKSQNIYRTKRFILNMKQYPEYDFVKLPTKKTKQFIEQIMYSDFCTITGYYLIKSNQQQLASVFLNGNSDCVILFSHGNACDLGIMIDKLIRLVHYTRTSVFAYEYSGYGKSQGTSSEINIIGDIQTAYKFLTQQLGYKPTQIIVYGYSIGSGPSVSLVSNTLYPVGGLIIQSGFSSGLRVLTNNVQETPFYDIFPNIDRISLIQCPIFIMHGAKDKIISDDHAKQLAEKAKNLYSVWIPEDVGHQGIDTNSKQALLYFNKMKEFISFIIQENESIPNLKIRNTALSQESCNHYYSQLLV